LYRETTDLGANEPIAIGCNVWIGSRVTILTGVRIGDGAVIGASSVVTRDVASCSVVVGDPARFVRWRFAGADRDRDEQHLQASWGHVSVELSGDQEHVKRPTSVT
jgi:acetyltransferase-like isoleucine patch superfamily enzyme